MPSATTWSSRSHPPADKGDAVADCERGYEFYYVSKRRQENMTQQEKEMIVAMSRRSDELM